MNRSHRQEVTYLLGDSLEGITDVRSFAKRSNRIAATKKLIFKRCKYE